ncbi:MAG: SpoIID/LytB domain-containing protein [Defluviitaleaceae bacterium]|nr:SpoIID/LytB domain-containing protein [Defluviitaleaceae bacterium]MCL2274573.1 SpoIID/LytB domain-containing protein [Defluviitaleaceae bacterium]
MRKLKIITFIVLLLAVAGGFPFAVQATAMPDTVRIGLTREFANRTEIPIGTQRIQVGYDNNGAFDAVMTLESPTGFTARVNDAGNVTLSAGGGVVFTFDRQCTEPQIREAGGGLVALGTSTYRGIIALRPANRLLTAINILCPEEYLWGVIPAEMSPSWHIQALMAQAVAARSYLISRALEAPHAAQAFHLCDTTCCQVFRGAGLEHENTTLAVNATRGTLIFHNNEVISAVYFSSSGGATANSEDVWVEARPYLRAVLDVNEHQPMEWTRTFTWAEINTLLATLNVNIGTPTGVTVTGVGLGGRVNSLTITGTNGQHTLTGDRIRTFFNPSAGGMLQSNNFQILDGATQQQIAVWVYDGVNVRSAPLSGLHTLNQNEIAVQIQEAYVFDGTALRRVQHTAQTITGGAGVTFVGRGWGHGVGMSQHGAEGMARLGFTYRQILMHYYMGVEIR